MKQQTSLETAFVEAKNRRDDERDMQSKKEDKATSKDKTAHTVLPVSVRVGCQLS
jgi:hypothetical protein